MTQVKTKAEYKAKQEKAELEFRRRSKNPNHIVRPGLTPRGSDILMRLNNKSLDLTGERSYTLNEDIVNAKNMSRHELIHAAKLNQEKISKLQNSLKSKEAEIQQKQEQLKKQQHEQKQQQTKQSEAGK